MCGFILHCFVSFEPSYTVGLNRYLLWLIPQWKKTLYTKAPLFLRCTQLILLGAPRFLRFRNEWMTIHGVIGLCCIPRRLPISQGEDFCFAVCCNGVCSSVACGAEGRWCRLTRISLCCYGSRSGAMGHDHAAWEQELALLPKATPCIQKAKALLAWV